ncbi:hypothetical protein WN51_04972 [Melipona quadrifasciata]|uniref:FAST kinase domain-containing protein 5 n=1 Tax=Melipona quadrifasciata TaxID=166423 RepID=A0A0M8ZRL3_9HYME|nr:hypothetical protein WN51_04972 [Melipona quadrifasciata]
MVAATDIFQNDSTKENTYIPEHKIIRKILQESTYYDKTIFRLIKTTAIVSSEDIDYLYTVNWFYESPNNIINAIKKLTYSYLNGTHLEIPLYDSILTACIKCLPQLQDQQIKILLQCSIALQEMIIKTICYKKFIKTLNTECIKRFYGSNVEQILLITDAFYQLDPLNSDFLWRAMRKLGTKVYKLSAKSLVQLFFILPVVNISSLNMYELECRVQECMCDLTGDELGIIARGFFRKKRRIQNRLLIPQIINKVIKQIDIIDDTSLASIMKLIRYSDCQHCLKDFQELLLSLHDEVPRLSLKCLIHTTHTFGSLRVYDEILTNKIVQSKTVIMRLKPINNKLGIELYSDYILPHYLNKDIIFGLDTHNNPVEIGSILSAMPLGSIKNVDTDELKNIKWKVLVPLSASVKIVNADCYIGYIYRKWRHLKIIGYTPIPICENIWECMDEESKAQHLRQLIYEDVQSDLFKT